MVNLLEDVKVLDLTHVHAGPLCTYQLALMGAQVVKVEAPESGDQMRGVSTETNPGMAPAFLGQNANKRSLAIDMKSNSGLQIVKKLIARADVLVTNMRPGTTDRLGVGYHEAKEMNPSIIYCAISGYGQNGPESDRAAMDHLIQGESGMISATGTPEQPARVGFAIADSGTAVISSSAICAALVRKGRTGEGAYLDVSMLESCITLMGINYYNFFATGRIGPRVGSNPLAQIGSAGTWPCAEGTLLVNANNQRLFERLASAVDRKDLLEDPRFKDIAASTPFRDDLREILGSIFITETASHWDNLLKEAGVPSGQLKTMDQVINHSQLAYRKTLAKIHDVPGSDSDSLTFVGAGFLVDNDPAIPTEPPPLLGQHTRAILEEIGIDPHDISTLANEGVIKCT